MGWGRFTFGVMGLASAVCAGLVLAASTSASATADAARSDPALESAGADPWRDDGKNARPRHSSEQGGS